jgi:hypothetical protein
MNAVNDFIALDVESANADFASRASNPNAYGERAMKDDNDQISRR